MSEKPILFNTEMVRAILDGKKTVTRRIVKPQPKAKLCFSMMGKNALKWVYPSANAILLWGEEFSTQNVPVDELKKIWNPLCKVGDRLWVREAFAVVDWVECNNQEIKKTIYRADGISSRDWRPKEGDKWKPSIHMPRAACRLFLEVESVSVERLHDITEKDAIAEGINMESEYASLCINIQDAPYANDLFKGSAALSVFRELWIKTYGQESWDANPWVWRVQFKIASAYREQYES